MIRPLESIIDWQVLRALVRASGPLSGLDLRATPHRRTKDGTFLDDLVELGLIERTGDVLPDVRKYAHSKETPVPFRTMYRITTLGRHAAEYGEFEWDFDAARRKGA